MRTRRKLWMSALIASALVAVCALRAAPAHAQGADDADAVPADQPVDEPTDQPMDDADAPPDDDLGPNDWDDTGDGDAPMEDQVADGVAFPLTIHIVTTRRTYDQMRFDIFDTATGEIAVSGRGADEAAGEPPPTFELPLGVYKIVRAGEPFETRVDFATISLAEPTNFVIVIDPDTRNFRGAGVVTDELPTGRTIGGIRVALNVGGSFMFNQQENVVGTTNGVSSQLIAFGNFSLVYDEGNSFLKVDSTLQLNIRDTEVASPAPLANSWRGGALYAYKINNPYVGPYARGSFATNVFPGYLYLEEEDAPLGEVNVVRPDNTVETYQFGTEANIDDLRIEVSQPFAPLILQEEIGGNLKAVDMDLRLLKLNVATRLGYAFRQGITNGLLVVDGSERGTPVTLREVQNYNTHGPVIGATATVTFARWLFGSGEFAMIVPLQDRDRAGDGFGDRLMIDFGATGGFKFPLFTSFLYGSVDYTFRLQRDGYLTSDTQFAHNLMIRANLQLF